MGGPKDDSKAGWRLTPVRGLFAIHRVTTVHVYIGYDARELSAYSVAASSLFGTSGIEAIRLEEKRLRRKGLYSRLSGFKESGQQVDLISRAPQSTDFALSRFLTPILCQSGYALFVDCDVVFLDDVHKMLDEVHAEHAVSVVKHLYQPRSVMKMDSQEQTSYSRKNWSSVMLFNCNHPANYRLTLHDVNTRPGLDLHSLYWLNDSEIGELNPRWNWLVGEQQKPPNPAIAHFTLGGPWIPDWSPKPHDEIWNSANANRPVFDAF